jgi:microcin C transport system permease protein
MLWDYFNLDFGNSYYQNRPVIDLILERMPVSISLGLWSMLLVYLTSIPLGVVKAVRDGTPFDAWTSGLIFVGYSIPSFLFAVILLVLFAGGAYFDWFPLKGLTSRHYVVTARAKGLTERRVFYGHVFRNAMLIVIAGFPAALVGILFTSTLLIEVIFSLHGLGLLGFEATLTRDYPIVFGTIFCFTFLSLILTLVGDITYTLVDPRIDFETRET